MTGEGASESGSGWRPHRHLAERDERILAAHAAASEVLALPVDERLDRLRTDRACQTVEFAELLIGLARERRFDAPREELRLARLALAAFAADRDRARDDGWATAHALAWAEVGNALRIGGELRTAAAAFHHARTAMRGSTDPAAEVDLLKLEASFLSYRREFARADRLLRRAERMQRHNATPEALARIWIGMADAASRSADFKRAISLLDLSLRFVDSRRSPHFVLGCVHNLAACLIEAGDWNGGLDLIERSRPAYEQFGDPRLQGRRIWVEAQARCRGGQTDRGELLLATARHRFVELACPYEITLISLELAMLYLHTGRWKQAEEAAVSARTLARAHGIESEGDAADAVLGDVSSRRMSRALPVC